MFRQVILVVNDVFLSTRRRLKNSVATPFLICRNVWAVCIGHRNENRPEGRLSFPDCGTQLVVPMWIAYNAPSSDDSEGLATCDTSAMLIRLLGLAVHFRSGEGSDTFPALCCSQ